MWKILDVAKASRDKGARGEREVRDAFRKHGFDVDRVPNSGGLRIRGDLYGNIPRLHIEVKRAERWDVPAWIKQAESDAFDHQTPIVCMRRNASRWYAVLPLVDLVPLLESANHDG